MKIPFNKPFLVGKELFYIAQAVMSGHISGDGKFTKKCHQWLEETLKTPQALLTTSCTTALEMAALLCEIKPGDEVILPSYTFVSTANAFALRGGIPVFVDIRPDTLNIDERLIEAAITSRTKAIVPVHYAGVPCEMDQIMDIAARHNLYVIEDAAQGLLSTYKGKYLGTIGHFGCLSFHETKNIISGEGGALLVNDEKFKVRAEIIREKGTNRSQFFRGQVDKYTWVELGSSFLPSDIIAAFLYAQFEQAEKINMTRKEICKNYSAQLAPLVKEGNFSIPPSQNGNGHMFYIVLPNVDVRTQLIEFLKTQNIFSVFHYVPLHSAPAGLKFGRSHGVLAITDDISDRLLRLPLFYEMTTTEFKQIIFAIKTFFSENKFQQ